MNNFQTNQEMTKCPSLPFSSRSHYSSRYHYQVCIATVQSLLLMLLSLTKLLLISLTSIVFVIFTIVILKAEHHLHFHFHHKLSSSSFFPGAQLPFILSNNNSRCLGSVCLGMNLCHIQKHTNIENNVDILLSLRYIFYIFSLVHALKLSVAEEGYDGGLSPEPLVNVTAVPLVSEILQVSIISYLANSAWPEERVTKGLRAVKIYPL